MISFQKKKKTKSKFVKRQISNRKKSFCRETGPIECTYLPVCIPNKKKKKIRYERNVVFVPSFFLGLLLWRGEKRERSKKKKIECHILSVSSYQ